MNLFSRVANSVRDSFEFSLLAAQIAAFFQNVCKSIRKFERSFLSVRKNDCAHNAWNSQKVNNLSANMEVAQLMFLRFLHNSFQ